MLKVKYIHIVAIFAAINLSSCQQKSTDIREFKIDNYNYHEWANLFNVEDVVQLHESDSCFMSYADKCIITVNNIIFEDFKAKRIYSFSHDGRFVCQIGSRGHASPEYIDIKDICMDENDSLLMVLESRGVVCYNPENGKFVKRVNFSTQEPVEYEKFMPMGNDEFICFTDNRNKYSVLVDSPKGQNGLREGKRFHFATKHFYRYNDNYRVVSDYGDFYIDTYKDGELETTYKIDLGRDQLPDYLRPQKYEEFENVDNSPDYFKCIIEAYETSNWLYLLLVGPQQKYYISFINKDNGENRTGLLTQDLGISVVGASNGYFYALIYPDYVSEDSFARKILATHSITENSPVIIKFRLNDYDL